MALCKICASEISTVIYEGPIRTGRYKELTCDNYSVLRCDHCDASWLSDYQYDARQFYETEEYRRGVDAGADYPSFYKEHDGEQLTKLDILTLKNLRNMTIADVGCGAGSFLDLVKGFSYKTIAVEPYTAYHEELARKGHEVYSYADEANGCIRGHVDLVTSYSVIEHIEDPMKFVSDMYEMLKPGGELCISTPNINDVLFSCIPDVYGEFFYRKAHLWYFSQESLRFILAKAGYKDIQIIPHHRFGIGNFLGWLADKKPQGELEYPFISSAMNALWKSELETKGICDYLYAKAIR